MRIIYIAAGAGGSYCGACARDVVLVGGLRERGHVVLLCPLYTLLRTDGPNPPFSRVFYGGINAYLQQKSWVFRKTPGVVDWLLDRPALLRFVSRFAIETRPEGLGDMTVSVLRGPEGFQRKELRKLIDFLAHTERPDVVSLTNSLLVGLAPVIKEELGLPVLCSLQGEESFVDRLLAPHREEAVRLMREHARAVALFIAPYAAYADEMSEFLAVERERIRVVRPGVDVNSYRPVGRRVRNPFRVGFLSRVSPAKGIDLLFEAFCRLNDGRSDAAPTCADTFLAVAGQIGGGNRKLWGELRSRLDQCGLADRLEYAGEPDFPGKVRFLRSCSVFCLPSRFPERRGIACIEALAAGVPVVLPDRGVFRQMVELTGGGLLTPPDDAEALAHALSTLRDNPDRADESGRRGAAGAEQHFSATEMVDNTLKAYEDTAGSS